MKKSVGKMIYEIFKGCTEEESGFTINYVDLVFGKSYWKILKSLKTNFFFERTYIATNKIYYTIYIEKKVMFS